MAERERLGSATCKSLVVKNGLTLGPGLATVPRVVKVPLAAVDAAGGCFAWLNPEPGAIVVTRIALDVTTVATGAGTVSAGTTVVSAATSSANLIDTLDVHTATGLFDNVTDKGSAGKSRQRLAAGGWVTGSKASGALAGLVGSAYIEYLPL